MLVVENCPTPHWVKFLVFNLFPIDLRYILLFELSDFDLKYHVTVTLKGQPPGFKASVRNFPIYGTGSKCNSLFRHADSN